MHVLLPLDEVEERAVAAAKVVSKIPNAAEEVTVTILNVQPKVRVADGDGPQIRSEEWYDEDQFPESVDDAIEVLETAGIAYNTRRDHDDPADAILNAADDLDVDWIIMSGRKRTPVGKVLFGSVTQSVMLNSDVPVTMVSE